MALSKTISHDNGRGILKFLLKKRPCHIELNGYIVSLFKMKLFSEMHNFSPLFFRVSIKKINANLSGMQLMTGKSTVIS